MRRRSDLPIIAATAGLVAAMLGTGLPVIAAVLGGIMIAAILGVTGGGLGVAIRRGGAVVAVGVRRGRAACQTTAPRTGP